MKTEEDKSKEQGKTSNRYQTMGMSIGMCFGVSIGLAFGNLLFDHGTLGMCLGLSIGMMIGMIAGSVKDKKVNEQLAEKGYRITAINMIDKDKYEITVSDKNDNVKKAEIHKGDMEVEQFQIGDLHSWFWNSRITTYRRRVSEHWFPKLEKPLLLSVDLFNQNQLRIRCS